MPGQAWTTILPFVHPWVAKITGTCYCAQPSFEMGWGREIFARAGLGKNCYPPNLYLLSSYDYRTEPPHIAPSLFETGLPDFLPQLASNCNSLVSASAGMLQLLITTLPNSSLWYLLYRLFFSLLILKITQEYPLDTDEKLKLRKEELVQDN
jgi:hypothetical protein